jgi:hypothetical protein
VVLAEVQEAQEDLLVTQEETLEHLEVVAEEVQVVDLVGMVDRHKTLLTKEAHSQAAAVVVVLARLEMEDQEAMVIQAV